MAKTQTEKMLSHNSKRKGVLVPLLEDLFQRPVEIESDEDVEWITALLTRMVERQNNRTTAPLYSPSQLASCLRHVYLLKHHREHEIEKKRSVKIEPHYYFFTGNFLHLKWQFALYKLEKKINDPSVFRLIGVEVPIVSKHRDHGGTVDAIVFIYGELYVVDFKGLNVRTFGEITRGYIPEDYAVQIGDYGMLYNAAANRMGLPRISKGLLVSENKGGPVNKQPLALHEAVIEIDTQLPKVRNRLKELRQHGKTNSIPPPECDKTTSYQFQGCPFRAYCRQEVKEIERRNRKSESRNADGLKVEVPGRRGDNRSRRNSK